MTRSPKQAIPRPVAIGVSPHTALIATISYMTRLKPNVYPQEPRADTFEANLLRHFQRVETESNSKKRKGVPKEAPPMPMPRHGLWSNDTIVSSARILNRARHHLRTDHKNDSDEEEEEELVQMPDYSNSNRVERHAI